MSLFQIINIITNLEKIFGVYRLYFKSRKRMKRLLMIMHSLLVPLIIFFCINIVKKGFQDFIFEKQYILFWYGYLFTQTVPTFTIQFFAFWYSSEYIDLIANLRRLHYAFINGSNKISNTYKYSLIFLYISCFILFLLDVCTSPSEFGLSENKFLFLIFVWYIFLY